MTGFPWNILSVCIKSVSNIVRSDNEDYVGYEKKSQGKYGLQDKRSSHGKKKSTSRWVTLDRKTENNERRKHPLKQFVIPLQLKVHKQKVLKRNSFENQQWMIARVSGKKSLSFLDSNIKWSLEENERRKKEKKKASISKYETYRGRNKEVKEETRLTLTLHEKRETEIIETWNRRGGNQGKGWFPLWVYQNLFLLFFILIFLSVFEVDFVSFSPFTAFSSCIFYVLLLFPFPSWFPLLSVCFPLLMLYFLPSLTRFSLFAPDRNGIFARLLPLLFSVDRPLTEHWENAVIYPVHYSILGKNIRPSSPPQCNSQMK